MTAHGQTLFLLLILSLTKGYDFQRLQTSPVYLTVSSLYREARHETPLVDREIQINWNENIERVALYFEDPSSNTKPVLEIDTEPSMDGFFETNITLGNPVFPGGWAESSDEIPEPGDRCLPFWVAGFVSNTMVHAECLKIRPTWMQDNRVAIGSLGLSSLFIPGTHNSGCYRRGEKLSLKDVTGRYLMTQDQDIWSQLVYGIRYFDLRVAYYPIYKNGTEVTDTDQSFWVNHDLIKVRPLMQLLESLKKFVAKTKEEVIFVDFHRFPVGFNNRFSRHKRLVELLDRELREWALPYTHPFPTLESVLNTKYRLIISYGENNIVKDNDWLWPGVSQMWGNQQTMEGLYEYLDSYMIKNDTGSTRIWAAMGHLTPAPLDILFKPKNSLRNLAHLINRNLTQWFRDDWWDKANIVASDFFLENDLIDIAVAANIEKGSRTKLYDVNV